MKTHLKSKLGLVMAVTYLFVFFFALIDFATAKPDAMSGLGVLFLTLPWSFSVLEVARDSPLADGQPATLFLLLTFCAILNAAVLYCVGLILITILSFIRRNLIGRKIP